jgi:Bacterial protein of unknown function (DUF948)
LIASLGGIAAIVAAIVGSILMLVTTVVLGIALFNLGTILVSVRTLVDGIREETVPLLGEVRTTVSNVNREMDRVDGLLESTGKIVKNVERLSSVIEQTVSSPLIKVAAAGYGISKVFKRKKKA